MKGADKIDKKLIERAKKFIEEPQELKVYRKKKSKGNSFRQIYVPSEEYRDFQKDLLKDIEPFIERVLNDRNYAYRKGISAHDCLRKIKEIVESDKIWVVKIDIKKFFENIDRKILLKKLMEILDDDYCKIIEKIIEAPVFINGREVYRGKGILQGYNLSPLLANIYLNSFDQCWDENKAHGTMVRYSDDILVFASGRKKARKNLQTAKRQLRELGLRCTNEGPINLRQDEVEFLSFRHYISSENKFIQIPTDKKIQMLKQKWREDKEKDRKGFRSKYYYFYNYVKT